MATLTFSNLETRVANRLRLPTSNATEMAKLDAVINDVYRVIASKRDWFWLDDRQVINTVAEITTGTVSVTNNSTAVTFSSAPAASVAGRVLSVTGNAVEPATYRISTHTAAATAATLESAYTGGTAATAAYHVWQDRYDLATDTGKIKMVKVHGWIAPLPLIGLEEMERLKQVSTSTGRPRAAAVYGYDTEGDPTTQRQLHVFPYPDDLYQMAIWFRQTLNTEVSGSTRLLIPDDWLYVLEFGVLADGYPIFLNDVERGQFYHARFVDALNLMAARHREHESPITMQPEDHYRRFYQSRRRISPTTADLGDAFGRYPTVP